MDDQVEGASFCKEMRLILGCVRSDMCGLGKLPDVTSAAGTSDASASLNMFAHRVARLAAPGMRFVINPYTWMWQMLFRENKEVPPFAFVDGLSPPHLKPVRENMLRDYRSMADTNEPDGTGVSAHTVDHSTRDEHYESVLNQHMEKLESLCTLMHRPGTVHVTVHSLRSTFTSTSAAPPHPASAAEPASAAAAEPASAAAAEHASTAAAEEAAEAASAAEHASGRAKHVPCMSVVPVRDNKVFGFVAVNSYGNGHHTVVVYHPQRQAWPVCVREAVEQSIVGIDWSSYGDSWGEAKTEWSPRPYMFSNSWMCGWEFAAIVFACEVACMAGHLERGPYTECLDSAPLEVLHDRNKHHNHSRRVAHERDIVVRMTAHYYHYHCFDRGDRSGQHAVTIFNSDVTPASSMNTGVDGYSWRRTADRG